jgi:hypothetical protein
MEAWEHRTSVAVNEFHTNFKVRASFMTQKILKQQRVLIASSTKVLSASFFPCLPLAKSIFISKMGIVARHF